MALFEHYIGIDYSGAKTPVSRLKGLRVYWADRGERPYEVLPPPRQGKYFTRKELAGWLTDTIINKPRCIIGVDHGFSFPLKYFKAFNIPLDWHGFLDDFQAHWPTADDQVRVDTVRKGLAGDGAARLGSSKWRRLCEVRSGPAKSVFHFDVPGSVAKSTHSGLPWLRHIRNGTGGRVHFWPFDGWRIPSGRSVMAEAYPSLWRHRYLMQGRTQDQHDAYCIAAWLRDSDLDGSLAGFLDPALAPADKRVAKLEGWILGVL
jgi:hypothetical protein